MKRRDQEYVGRRLWRWYHLGEEKEEDRSRDGWTVNRDIRAIGTTKNEVHDRTGWRRIVSAAAKWEQLEEEVAL